MDAMKLLLVLVTVIGVGFAATASPYGRDSLLIALEEAAGTQGSDDCYMRVNVDSCSSAILLQTLIVPGGPRFKTIDPSEIKQHLCLSVPCRDHHLTTAVSLAVDGGPVDVLPDNFDVGAEVYGDEKSCIAGAKGHSAFVTCDEDVVMQKFNEWTGQEAPTSDAYIQLEYVEDIQVGDFGEGYIVELLYRAPERGRTAIDFYAENGDRILHVNPRYDEKVIVLNSKLNGKWGAEERPNGFPLTPGEYTTITVMALSDGFEVYANADKFRYFYKYRAPVTQVTRVAWRSPNTDGFMELEKMLEGYGPYRVLYIQGRAPESGRFSIDVMNRGGIAFHFNPRFDEKLVVRNSHIDGEWGVEERDGSFPFQQGEEFAVAIICTPDTYEVTVDGKYFISYRQRIPYASDTSVEVHGFAEIKSILYI